jgi:hypothetical protein
MDSDEPAGTGLLQFECRGIIHNQFSDRGLGNNSYRNAPFSRGYEDFLYKLRPPVPMWVKKVQDVKPPD